MIIRKALPLIVAASLTVGSGTLVAVAQDATTGTTQAELQHVGERGPRHARHHGKRRGGMHRAMMRDLFEQADANGDGAVTRDEILAARAARVGAADTNGDSTLSLAEFETLYRQGTRTPMVRAFQRLDRNGDGVIDTVEMERPMERMIERMDRDGDGTLTLRRGRGERD